MNYCSDCGNKLRKADKFCSNCGKKINKSRNKNLSEEEDIKENKGIAILSYLGILTLIPYIMADDSDFAYYHAKQGMNFLIVWVAYAVMYRLLTLIKVSEYVEYWYTSQVTPWYILAFLYLIGIALVLISIIGIINVYNGKKEELPLIGKIKIIK